MRDVTKAQSIIERFSAELTGDEIAAIAAAGLGGPLPETVETRVAELFAAGGKKGGDAASHKKAWATRKARLDKANLLSKRADDVSRTAATPEGHVKASIAHDKAHEAHVNGAIDCALQHHPGSESIAKQHDKACDKHLKQRDTHREKADAHPGSHYQKLRKIALDKSRSAKTASEHTDASLAHREASDAAISWKNKNHHLGKASEHSRIARHTGPGTVLAKKLKPLTKREHEMRIRNQMIAEDKRTSWSGS